MKLLEVKKYFNDHGCKLLEKKYVNAHVKMKYLCSCNNVSYINLNNFKNGKRCGCGRKGARKYSELKIKEIVESKGFVFISSKYINNHHVVACMCKCGKKRTCQLKNINKSEGCSNCLRRNNKNKIKNNLRNKYDINYVKDFFEKNNCVFLSKEYKNNFTLYDYICSCGNKSKISFSCFKNGSRCKDCGIKKMILKKFDPASVEKKFIDSKCTLIDVYVNSHKHMRYICACGEKSITTWNNFSKGKLCKKCGIKKISGENNYGWQKDRDKHREKLIFRQKSYKLIKMTMNVTGRVKNKKTAALLGYDYLDLQKHISQYPGYDFIKDKPWHIDHIFPIKAFIDHGIDDFSLINCLENLRPISAKENLIKNSKYDKLEFLDWLKKKNVNLK